MYLELLTLRDWKAFEHATFEFPAPTKRKNVVLIGGRNGFGKTSIFEALALGLFGRDGLALVLRAGAASDEQRRVQTFRDFMERALFAGALPAGRSSCRIGLKFVDEDGEPTWIERTWYFTDSGALRAGYSAEQLQVFQGADRQIVAPLRSEPDHDGWYRDWISRTFLPTSLAGFFLYDGESASIYAERDMARQVRDGIEGLLGLTWLRRLQKDLRDYAHSRRAQAPKGAAAEDVGKLEAELTAVEQDVASWQARLQEVESALADSDIHLDRLTRALGYGAGTRAESEVLARKEAQLQADYGAAQLELIQFAQRDLPFALVGRELLESAIDRLQVEGQEEQWQAQVQDREVRSERARARAAELMSSLDPPLPSRQRDDIETAFTVALDAIWEAPSVKIGALRHSHAQGRLRQRVMARLDAARHQNADAAFASIEAMHHATASIRSVEQSLERSKGASSEFNEGREELGSLIARQGSLREERGSLTNLLRSRVEELNQKQRELTRLTGKLDAAVRPSRLARRADQIAEMLVELVAEAWPIQADALAFKMSHAIQQMAHRKDYLESIAIDDEGGVSLLSPSGRNLRQFDLSAGEKQIFTQALFSAIGEISGREFPMVIDTPLGRLDDAHRINVLRHLVKREGQVFLISTDTEVIDGYLDVVRSRISKSYVIHNEVRDGIAVSSVQDDYFPGQHV